MWSPGSPPDSLPAAPQLSGELRPRQAVTRLKEGEIAVHLLAREILPCPCEFQERAARSGEPSHDLAEALSLPLEEGQGLESDEVVQLFHDLRREDRLELGEELGLRRPKVPPARNEQQDPLAEQATRATRPSLPQDGVDGQGDDRRERVFDALTGPR